MILVTTPTGNSGRHVLRAAIDSGQPVRTLVRKASRIDAALRARCEVVEGDLRDEAVLARAAEGTTTSFFCVPQSGESDDVAAYYRSFVEPAARALGGKRRVVTISGGRGEPSDPGPSGPLAAMEKAFDATGAATRHVRCGYFMENFLYAVPQLKFKGSFSLPLAPSDVLALESAEDIGKTAARWLLDGSWSGQKGVSVPQGELLSCARIAEVLSESVGKRIRFDAITPAAYEAMLTKFGVSAAMARSLRDMFADLDHGSIGGRAVASKSVGVPFATWARDTLRPELAFFRVLKRVLS